MLNTTRMLRFIVGLRLTLERNLLFSR